MPFAETHVMEEKKRFIEEAHRSVRSFAAVCDRYGISRKTGYKVDGSMAAGWASGFGESSESPQALPMGYTA